MDMNREYSKDEHIAQLEEVNKALAEKLTFLNKRAMARHDKTSLKWRNRAFYLGKKCTALEKLLVAHGIVRGFVKVDLADVKSKMEVGDERKIRSNSNGEMDGKGRVCP